MGESRMRIFSL